MLKSTYSWRASYDICLICIIHIKRDDLFITWHIMNCYHCTVGWFYQIWLVLLIFNYMLLTYFSLPNSISSSFSMLIHDDYNLIYEFSLRSLTLHNSSLSSAFSLHPFLREFLLSNILFICLLLLCTFFCSPCKKSHVSCFESVWLLGTFLLLLSE